MAAHLAGPRGVAKKGRRLPPIVPMLCLLVVAACSFMGVQLPHLREQNPANLRSRKVHRAMLRGRGLSLQLQSAPFDGQLAEALVGMLKGSSVSQFTAGDGSWVDYFNHSGKHIKAQGFDAPPRWRNTTQASSKVPHPASDWTLCLQTGKHNFDDLAAGFIKSMAGACIKGVIISWASTDVSDAFNARSNAFINKGMLDLGFVTDLDAEASLQAAAEIKWLKATLLVFRKRASTAT